MEPYSHKTYHFNIRSELPKILAVKSLDEEETKYSIKTESIIANDFDSTDFQDSLIDSMSESCESHFIQKVPVMSELCRSILEKFQSGEQSADVNYKGADENTALHLSAAEGYLKVCENLIDYGEGTHINARNTRMESPLHLSCSNGHLKISQLLVRSGADINAIDINGNTPLHRASLSGHSNVIAWLLTRGPNLTIKNMQNRTADEVSTNAVSAYYQKYLKRTISLPGPSISPSLKNEAKKYRIQDLSNIKEAGKISCHDFIGICELGHGSFGDVYLVTKHNTGKLYAMKVLRKDRIIERNLIKYALTERNVLTYIKHPFIVSLNFAFQTLSKLFLILDYCAGGDLSSHLMKEKKFPESRAKIYVCEIVLALEELHKNDIIYRDLKPDNIVLDKDGHALLTDFGLSKEGILDNYAAKSFCGSLAYLAPEMIERNGHGKAVDWYLLGVVFYEMVVGIPPFFSMNKDELMTNIQRAKIKIPGCLSVEAKELIKDVRFI
jgi:protein-serine/threonine kinase